MNIHLKIKEIVDNKGAEIIASNKLVGMLDDERVFEDIESAPYKKILRNIIKDGYAQKLLDSGCCTSDVKYLASQYARANLMQEAPVLYVLDCLAYGLGKTKKEPTLPQTSSQYGAPTSKAQKASSANKQKAPSYRAPSPTPSGTAQSKKQSALSYSVWHINLNAIQAGTERIFDVIKEDVRWLMNDKDVKGELGVSCILLSVIIAFSSIIAMVIGWYYDIGHAPVWTLLFWESVMIGSASAVYLERSEWG